MAQVIERVGYETLRDQIVQVLQTGKERAQRAVEEETLRTYHEIGCLLNDYVLDNKERADYGTQTITRLAEEVGMSQTLLYQTVAFYRLEPILHARVKLECATECHWRATVKSFGWWAIPCVPCAL